MSVLGMERVVTIYITSTQENWQDAPRIFNVHLMFFWEYIVVMTNDFVCAIVIIYSK